jgi:hypothetical protein
MPVDPSARKPGEDWIAVVRKNGPKAHSRHACPNTFDGVAPTRWVREIILSIAEQLRSKEGCAR